jgi:hypothetical protein
VPTPSSEPLVLSLASPVVAPLGESRHPVDIVLAITETQQALFVDLPWSDVERVLRDAVVAGGARAVREALGVGFVELASEAETTTPSGSVREATIADVTVEPAPAVDGVSDGLLVVPFVSVRAGEDGRAVDREWLRELPDPVASVQWDAWIEIADADAAAQGLATGNRVRLETIDGGRSLEAGVFVSPTVRPGTVSVPLGFGHRGRGPSRYAAASRASNAFDLIGEERVEGVGSPALAAVRVHLMRIDGPPVPIYGRGLRQAEEIPRGWGAHQPERRSQREPSPPASTPASASENAPE